MGRWSFSSKQEADYLKKVEIWWLKKHGYLNGWKSGGIEWKNEFSGDKSSIGIEACTIEGYVRFFYTQTEENGEKKKFDYKVQLTTTPCNYGGVRYWFICPLVKNGQPCGRQVGVLYKAGDYFGCRHCYELTYSSKNENRRYKSYPLLFWLKSWKKIEELEEKIKRPYYRGKPTRKQRRLEKIENRMMPYLDLIKKEKL
jgi:hypothetical protein